MNLHELYSKPLITEGAVEPNVMLSVSNLVARGGKNPNTFELMVIARMLQMMENGTFYKETNPLESNLSTSKYVIDALRACSADQLAQVAGHVYRALTVKDGSSPYCVPGRCALDWIKYFTSREATD